MNAKPRRDVLERAREWQARKEKRSCAIVRELISEVERLRTLELELRLEIAIYEKRVQMLKNPKYYQELGDKMRAAIGNVL